MLGFTNLSVLFPTPPPLSLLGHSFLSQYFFSFFSHRVLISNVVSLKVSNISRVLSLSLSLSTFRECRNECHCVNLIFLSISSFLPPLFPFVSLSSTMTSLFLIGLPWGNKRQDWSQPMTVSLSQSLPSSSPSLYLYSSSWRKVSIADVWDCTRVALVARVGEVCQGRRERGNWDGRGRDVLSIGWTNYNGKNRSRMISACLYFLFPFSLSFSPSSFPRSILRWRLSGEFRWIKPWE